MSDHIRLTSFYLAVIPLFFSLFGCTSTNLVSRSGLTDQKEVVFSSGDQQGLITLDERIQFEALKAKNIYTNLDTLYWDDPTNDDFCAAHIKHVKIITLFNKRRGMQNGMLAGGSAGGLLTLLLSESQKADEVDSGEGGIGIQGIVAGIFAGGLAGVLVGAFSGSPDNYKLTNSEYDHRSIENGSDRKINSDSTPKKRRKRIYRLDGE